MRKLSKRGRKLGRVWGLKPEQVAKLGRLIKRELHPKFEVVQDGDGQPCGLITPMPEIDYLQDQDSGKGVLQAADPVSAWLVAEMLRRYPECERLQAAVFFPKEEAA